MEAVEPTGPCPGCPGCGTPACAAWAAWSAPLPRDDSISIGETGLQANNAPQDSLGRLRGGGEVILFGQQHSISDAGDLDFAGKNLGPVEAKKVAAFFASPKSATVRRLTLSGNPLTGGRYNGDCDKGLSGVTALFDTLKASSVTKIGLANCRLGPRSVGKLAEYVREASSVVDEMNVSMNPIGVDGAKALAEVLPESTLKCLIIGPKSTRLPVNDAEATELNFEGQKFTPTEVTLVAKAISTMAALASVNFSGNPLTGATYNSILGRWENIDSDLVGFIALCSVLGKLNEVNLSDCHLGPASVAELAKVFSDADAVVTDLNVSEAVIGDAGATLVEAISSSTTLNFITIGKALRLPLKDNYDSDVLDASQKGIEPGGVAVITWWLTTLAAAVIETIAIAANPITLEGGTILLETIKTSKLKTIDIGNPLPLQQPYESDTLDLSNTQVDPGHVLLLSWWLGTEFSAAMNCLTLDMNGIFGELPQADKFAGDCDAFFAALKTSNIVTLSLQKTGVGPITLRKLATSLPAAVTQLILDGNILTDYERNLIGITALFDALKASSVTNLGLANCHLGPGSLAKLAEYIREAAAVLKKVDLSKNFHSIDADQTGWTSLCESFKSSSIEELILCDVGMGVNGVALLADAIKSMDVLASLRLGGTNFGDVYTEFDNSEQRRFRVVSKKVSFRNSPETEDRCGKGVVARANSIHNAIDETEEWIQLEENKWLPKKSLAKFPTEPCVFYMLCTVLKTSQVAEVNLSNCGLKPRAIALLADAIKFMAALNSLTLDSTGVPKAPHGYYGYDESGPRTYTLIVGEKTIDLISKNLGVADVNLVAIWIKRPEVSAAIARLTLNGNKITGKKWNGFDYDTDLSGFISLCVALPGLKNLTTLELAGCGLGDSEVNELAKAMGAGAAVAHLALGSNTIGDEAMIHLLDALKDVPLISLDISSTACGKPSAIKLIEILATTQKDDDIMEGRCAKRRMLADGANGSYVAGAMQPCTLFRMCIEKINVRNWQPYCRPVFEEVLQAASEVSRARLRTYQVLAYSQVFVDRLGESSSLQILSEDVCIQVAREVFSTRNHEGLCVALSRLGQAWFSAKVSM
eukprot:COSAG03_NODE_464_length_7697_cov_3.596999_2_plen_1099_part_00